uniref:Uncharacterized protein n=1 Tax=Eptatretus burgeri TaxID=7764 RepID=A0A8C4QXI9_EPTBU
MVTLLNDCEHATLIGLMQMFCIQYPCPDEAFRDLVRFSSDFSRISCEITGYLSLPKEIYKLSETDIVFNRSGCRFRYLSGIGTLDIDGSAGSESAVGHTLDPIEVAKFRVLSRQWWNERGKFAALHRLNDLRVPFVRDGLLLGKPAPHSAFPLRCQKILDVGCGGGLLSEVWRS